MSPPKPIDAAPAHAPRLAASPCDAPNAGAGDRPPGAVGGDQRDRRSGSPVGTRIGPGLGSPIDLGFRFGPTDDEPPRRTDGRHARSERSRQAMVDALLDLLREGNVRPSSAQIAERAGVTQRTLFNQFGDMESLVQSVAARQIQRFMRLLPEATGGTLDERVTSYCDGLERLLEEIMHVRWALVTTTNPVWAEAEVLDKARDFMRMHLVEAFADELGPLTDEAQDEVLDILELEVDPIVWRSRRVALGLTSAQARAQVERTLRAVLRDALRHDRADATDQG